jgi:hypothetical protein
MLIVPGPDLGDIWSALPLRDGERKINVFRRGDRWNLRVASIDRDVPMDRYLYNFAAFKQVN